MNKPYLYLFSFLLLVLASCEETPGKQQATTDTRPKGQLQLIKAFNDADSTYDSQDNEIAKKEALDSGRAKVSGFILKDLDSKIENWPAIFENLEVSELGDKDITVSLLIPLRNNFDKKLPESHSILLSSTVRFDDKQIKDQLKTLKPFDKVVVTGIFEKDVLDNIDISASSLYEPDTFSDSKLLFKIISVKKSNIEPAHK